MYIDKIYTKLYSNKDWNGLKQLVNEIKSFAISERNRRALNAKLKKSGKMWKSDGTYDDDHIYRGPISPSTSIVHELARAKKMGNYDEAYKYRKILENMYDNDISLDEAKNNVAGILGKKKLAIGGEYDPAVGAVEDFRERLANATVDRF